MTRRLIETEIAGILWTTIDVCSSLHLMSIILTAAAKVLHYTVYNIHTLLTANCIQFTKAIDLTISKWPLKRSSYRTVMYLSSKFDDRMSNFSFRLLHDCYPTDGIGLFLEVFKCFPDVNSLFINIVNTEDHFDRVRLIKFLPFQVVQLARYAGHSQ